MLALLLSSVPGVYSGDDVTMDGEYVSPNEVARGGVGDMETRRVDSRFCNILFIALFSWFSSPGGPGESGDEGSGISSM